MELSLPLNGYSLELPLNKIFMFLTFHSCFPSFEIAYAMSFLGSSPSLRLRELLVNLVFLAQTKNPHSLQQFCSLVQKKALAAYTPLPILVCPSLSVSFLLSNEWPRGWRSEVPN